MAEIQLLPTGIPNLDAALGGGIPIYSLNIIAGPPGTGKTILAQQMLFSHVRHNGAAKGLYFTTLSEPAVKVVRYMQQFTFFDADAFGERVIYHDLGRVIRDQSLPEVTEYVMGLVEEQQPEIVVIDSFKAIRDLSDDVGAFRRFCYDLSVRFASARCTAFFAGECDGPEIASGAEFAVADGILYLGLSQQEGESRRFLQLLKVRGQPTDTAPYPLAISSEGMRIFSSDFTLRPRPADPDDLEARAATGIVGLDALMHGGIPRGYCIILAGVSGAGKTICALQTLAHGAALGEKGLLVSFEESPERLRQTAAGLGWDLAEYERQGLIRILHIAQDSIRVEEHLEAIVQEFDTFQPHRFVLDSFSVYLHKVTDLAIQREKTYQLSTLAWRTGALGILISDTPSNEPHRISRYGVEETVADGTIALSTEVDGLARKRYVEVYKLRAVDHVTGRYRMEITDHGLEVYYTIPSDWSRVDTPPPLAFPPLREVIQGELRYGSAWLVQGEPGVGKSTLAYQFAMEGLRRREAVLYIAADAPSVQVRQAIQSFGFLTDPYLEDKQLVIRDIFGDANTLDLNDPETLLFSVVREVERMPKPLRLVIDSLTPLALGYAPSDFVALVHRQLRLLRRPDVTVFCTLLRQTLPVGDHYSLLNAFDVVVDLLVPDWGEMRSSRNGDYRALQVRKARGVRANTQLFPYTISPTEGVVIHKAFSQP